MSFHLQSPSRSHKSPNSKTSRLSFTFLLLRVSPFVKSKHPKLFFRSAVLLFVGSSHPSFFPSTILPILRVLPFVRSFGSSRSKPKIVPVQEDVVLCISVVCCPLCMSLNRYLKRRRQKTSSFFIENVSTLADVYTEKLSNP